MNTDDIQKLAGLARLSITDEEAGALSNDMNAILGYIKQIENAHIETGEKTTPVVQNVTREDVASDSNFDTQSRIKMNFPKEKNGYLEVNKIINND